MNDMNIRRLENRLINASQANQIQREGVKSKDFGQVLEKIYKKNQNILFSKHAIERMDKRNMKLTSEEINKLQIAFDKAQNKGVKDALILMNDKAFIASIKNKTIITSLNKEQLKDNIFTNIDGAVII